MACTVYRSAGRNNIKKNGCRQSERRVGEGRREVRVSELGLVEADMNEGQEGEANPSSAAAALPVPGYLRVSSVAFTADL